MIARSAGGPSIAVSWLAAALLLPTSLGAAPSAGAPAPFAIEEIKLGKGRARLVVAERASERASLKVSFRVGSFDDGNDAGLTRLAQRSLLLANDRFDHVAFERALREGAGSLEVLTSAHEASFVLHAPSQTFDALAKQLIDGLLKPKPVPERFPVAVRATLQDELVAGDPRAWLHQVLTMVMPSPGYQTPPHGERSALLGITPGDLKARLKAAFTPANATVTAAGAFSLSKLRKTLRRHKGGKLRERLGPIRASNGEVMMPAFFETHVIGFPVALREPSDAALLAIAKERIASSLFFELRREGLTYSSGAFVYQNMRGTWLQAWVTANPHRHHEAQLKMTEVFDHLLSSEQIGISFEQARAQAASRLRRNDREPTHLIHLIAGDPLLHSRLVLEQIDATTEADFGRWAKRSLAPDDRFHVHFSIDAKRQALIDKAQARWESRYQRRRTRRRR